jgi:hypothetical protein
MPVSSDGKCLFVHIPKCGGTSIEIALGIADSYPKIGLEPTSTSPNFRTLFGGGLQHLTAKEIQNNFGDIWRAKKKSFSIMRDPVDRLVSHFIWKHYRFSDLTLPIAEVLEKFVSYVGDVRELSRSTELFKDPFDGMEYFEGNPNAVSPNSVERHILPQSAYVFVNGEVQVDRLFNINDMAMVESFLARSGFLSRDLPHVMAGKASQALRRMIPRRVVGDIRDIYHHDFRILRNECEGRRSLAIVGRLKKALKRPARSPVAKSAAGGKPFIEKKPSSSTTERRVPRRVWMYWHQGWDCAPQMINACRESWLKRNPAWEISFVDKQSLAGFVRLPTFYDDDSLAITPAALSDVIRIHLLTTHGGVWADATTWCVRPLDDWIDLVTAQSGFFAYAKPGPDRPISSWFLASTVNNYLADRLKDATNVYWERHVGSNSSTSSDLSDSPSSKEYFWFHKLFGQLLQSDSRYRELWNAVPEISADAPHYLQRVGLTADGNHETEYHIRNRLTNVYKLNHRIALPADVSGTVIGQLFSSL